MAKYRWIRVRGRGGRCQRSDGKFVRSSLCGKTKKSAPKRRKRRKR